MAVVDATTASSLLSLYNSAKSGAMSEADFANQMATIIGDAIRSAQLLTLVATGNLGAPVVLVSSTII